MANAFVALVVEDEALIRGALAMTLEDAGFETFEAGSAAEAIEILERVQTIRVVFTDVEMPGTMDGIALTHHIRERWPPTLLVVVSGRPRPQDGVLPGGVSYVMKPYGASEMASLLAEVKRRLQHSSI